MRLLATEGRGIDVLHSPRSPAAPRTAPSHAVAVAGDDADDDSASVERNYLDDLNPDSKRVITAFVEPALADAAAEERFQFERHGYFVADQRDHDRIRYRRHPEDPERWTIDRLAP